MSIKVIDKLVDIIDTITLIVWLQNSQNTTTQTQ